MIGMTKRQADCLRAIEELTVDGVSPTYAEIATHMGLTAKGGVCRLVTGLAHRGLIRRYPHRSRTLEVVRPATLTKTRADIADEVCRRVWDRNDAGLKVRWSDLNAIVLEVLQ